MSAPTREQGIGALRGKRVYLGFGLCSQQFQETSGPPNMWSFLLLGGGPCFRGSASLSCGRAILVPRNALLLMLTATTSASGAGPLGPCSLGGEGCRVPPTPACALAGRSGGDAEHVALEGSSLEPPGSSSSCHTKASCSGRDKSPFLIVEQKNRPSPSSRGRGRVAPGLCLICCFFPGSEQRKRPWWECPPSGRSRRVLVCVWCLSRVIFSTQLSTGPCNWAPPSHFPLWPLD